MCPNYFFFFFQKMLKAKQLGNKLPSHSANNLKPKTFCGQSSIKAFYKGLSVKKGKLDMITSTVNNKYAVVKSFGFSSIGLSSFFFWKI